MFAAFSLLTLGWVTLSPEELIHFLAISKGLDITWSISGELVMLNVFDILDEYVFVMFDVFLCTFKRNLKTHFYRLSFKS